MFRTILVTQENDVSNTWELIKRYKKVGIPNRDDCIRTNEYRKNDLNLIVLK